MMKTYTSDFDDRLRDESHASDTTRITRWFLLSLLIVLLGLGVAWLLHTFVLNSERAQEEERARARETWGIESPVTYAPVYQAEETYGQASYLPPAPVAVSAAKESDAELALYVERLAASEAKTKKTQEADPTRLSSPFAGIAANDSERQNVAPTTDAPSVIGGRSCRLSRVIDGNTITILCGSAASVETVRLIDVDAPVIGQAFGNRAKENLGALCADQEIRLDRQKQNAAGQTLAVVYCADEDVNAKQVESGYAWASIGNIARARAQVLTELEELAREEQRGLWADKEPMPPADFRKMMRQHTDIADDGKTVVGNW